MVEGDDALVFALGSVGGESRVTALSVETGQHAWETVLPGAEHEPRWTLAVERGAIVAVSGGGHVYCMDPVTGAGRWQQSVDRPMRRNDREPLVLVVGERVLVSLQGLTTCFDAGGRAVWSRKTGTGALGVVGRVVEPR